MATVTNWVDHLNAGDGVVYPFVGTELWWLILCIGIWIVWHIITSASESDELEDLAQRNPGPDAHKQNITDW